MVTALLPRRPVPPTPAVAPPRPDAPRPARRALALALAAVVFATSGTAAAAAPGATRSSKVFDLDYLQEMASAARAQQALALLAAEQASDRGVQATAATIGASMAAVVADLEVLGAALDIPHPGWPTWRDRLHFAHLQASPRGPAWDLAYLRYAAVGLHDAASLAQDGMATVGGAALSDQAAAIAPILAALADTIDALIASH